MKIINKLLLFAVFMGSVFALQAQTTKTTMAPISCNGFALKQCKFDWDDFRSNGQDVSADMEVGETADLSMVFYKGHDYKVYVCSEETLGDMSIKIKTSSGEVLFDNAKFDNSPSWDFSMSSTRRLIVEITSPGGGGSSEDGFVESGCVALMVGVRPTTHKGFK